MLLGFRDIIGDFDKIDLLEDPFVPFSKEARAKWLHEKGMISQIIDLEGPEKKINLKKGL